MVPHRLAAVLVSLGLTNFSPAAEAPRPNVVVFLVDDMGWMDCGAYGSKYYDTPNIDRLATRSIRFTAAYACPLCSPTRASILSGQYSARHGTTSATGHQPPQPVDHKFLPDAAPANQPLLLPESKNYLDPAQFTLAEALHDAGYRTAHLGKWHLGTTRPHWPEAQGFDTAFHCHPDPGPPGNYFSPYGVVAEGQPSNRVRVGTITDGPPGEYIVDRLADEAVRFIEENRDRPFFLNLWNYGVHGPWGHKVEYTAKYAERTDPRGEQGNPIMASMLRSVDDCLGRVVGRLDELGLTERTVIVFLSDNGGNVHSNVPDGAKTKKADAAFLADWRKWAGDRPPTNNAPLRQGKGTLYEGGTRVPMMACWPGRIAAGSTCDAVVGAVDVYPTLLELVGLEAHPTQKLDGRSLTPVLLGTSSTDALAARPYFNYFPHGGPAKPPGVSVRLGSWKLIRWWMTGPAQPATHELYDLAVDLGERNNLASAMPEKTAELDALIDGFLRDTGALYPRPNPAYRESTRPAAARTAQPLEGWKAQGCTATMSDGILSVTSDRTNAFLGIAGLRLGGPTTVTLRTRGAAGRGSIQWRTVEQETFPETGQTVEFSYPGGAAWSEIEVVVPERRTIVHWRIRVPPTEQAVDFDAIRAVPKTGRASAWEFDSTRP